MLTTWRTVHREEMAIRPLLSLEIRADQPNATIGEHNVDKAARPNMMKIHRRILYQRLKSRQQAWL